MTGECDPPGVKRFGQGLLARLRIVEAVQTRLYGVLQRSEKWAEIVAIRARAVAAPRGDRAEVASFGARPVHKVGLAGSGLAHRADGPHGPVSKQADDRCGFGITSHQRYRHGAGLVAQRGVRCGRAVTAPEMNGLVTAILSPNLRSGLKGNRAARVWQDE